MRSAASAEDDLSAAIAEFTNMPSRTSAIAVLTLWHAIGEQASAQLAEQAIAISALRSHFEANPETP